MIVAILITPRCSKGDEASLKKEFKNPRDAENKQNVMGDEIEI